MLGIFTLVLSVVHGVFVGRTAVSILNRWSPDVVPTPDGQPFVKADTLRQFIAARIILESPNSFACTQLSDADRINVYACEVMNQTHVIRAILWSPHVNQPAMLRALGNWHRDTYVGVTLVRSDVVGNST